MPGDTVGIIGKNGAGKSTLLKILSKITPPTSGKIIGRGRIASLLEVGTGFHPELSGRENIFMNGSILGMRHAEIQRNFDAIVDFAGVEKFIDTPLKHYSSGMQLRLAFAVAAFLENEILIIDEVLAVGDAEFQRKCMGKMEDVSRSGRTILFVSHQLGAINTLCSKSALLNKGQLQCFDKTKEVVELYLSKVDTLFQPIEYTGIDTGKKLVYFKHVYITDSIGKKESRFAHSQSIKVNFQIAIQKKMTDIYISFALLDKFGNRVFTSLKELDCNEGILNANVELPASLIAPNKYSIHFALCKTDGTIFDIKEERCHFIVYDDGTAMSLFEGKDYGSIIVNCKWN